MRKYIGLVLLVLTGLFLAACSTVEQASNVDVIPADEKELATAAAIPIGDFVWWDMDQDGIQDDCETGVADVDILLLDINGVVLDTYITDEYGSYIFSSLAPFEHVLRFSLPESFDSFTQQNQGNNNAIDSDIDVSTGEILVDVANVTLGLDNLTFDVGLVKEDSTSCETITPAELVEYIETELSGMSGLQGILDSLQAALNALEEDPPDIDEACKQLDNFIKKVSKRADKINAQPSDITAEELEESANDIKDSLSCDS